MTMPRMAKANEPDKDLLRTLLPDDPRVELKPMFGTVSAFVNGNMFTGIFGHDLYVRLSEEDRAALLREDGAHLLEPMPGRPMRECVVMPDAWRDQAGRMREWVQRSLEWTASMPPKEMKAPKAGKKKG